MSTTNDVNVGCGFITGIGSSVLGFALNRVGNFGDLAWNEIRLIWCVEDEFRKLQRTFLRIQELVDVVESSPLRFSDGSKAWQIWFEDLRKLAYDADSLLDHVSLHVSTCETNGGTNNFDQKQTREKILGSGQYNVPHKINGMQKQLEDLAIEIESLMKIEMLKVNICKYPTRGKFSVHNSNSTSLLADEGVIVGRQQDKQKLINLLRQETNVVSVIPLVGMAGIGKTTLAQLVFNDDEAFTDFNLKIWVSAYDFDVVRITKSIIESAIKKTCNLSDLDPLQHKLQHILLSRGKLLLVLDDYWNESRNDWDLLFSPLRSALKGSKVIVTTRSSKISTIVGSTEPQNLEALSDDDCWMLMKQRAFFRREENQTLESLGKDIAKKCQGLPLAAKTLGSVLHCQPTKDKWQSILKSELWDLPLYKNGIFPSLMLSYLHLPPHLQKCFAYCSIFPRNHEFEVEELVHLWMAEGFIQSGEERRPEELGRHYFHDLHSRFFFVQGTSSSHQTIYKMHALIHDLARLVSTDTCIQVQHDTSHPYPLFGNTCHLSLHHDNVTSLELKAVKKNKRLRTFLVMCKHGTTKGKIFPSVFTNLKYVRVLDLSNIGLCVLPDLISSLKYLRYLNLSGSQIDRIPESLCELLAMQTLKLLNCPKLQYLPSDMKKLSNLRHLIFDNLRSMPEEFGKLTNLQTLSSFIVESSKGKGIEELAKMDLLEGSLCIKNIEKVTNEKNAIKAELHMKPYLNKLALLWGDSDKSNDEHRKILKNLHPHENLKELEIKNYSAMECPNWISDSCRKFTTIHLQGLSYCTVLPSFGQLPFLKSLIIEGMHGLTFVRDEFCGVGNDVKFPSLESLEVYQMDGLTEWKVSKGIRCMPRLTSFKIEGCPVLTSLPEDLQRLPNSSISRCPKLSSSGQTR